MLRTASIFQAIAAICTALIQGSWLVDLFYRQWANYSLYDCLTAACTTLLAIAILFSILVSRNSHNTPFSIMCFECVKTVSATALWLWLLLDSMFGPNRWKPNKPEDREKRVTLSAVSVLLLLVGFIPTAVFAYYNYRHHGRAVVDEEQDGERAPLLQS